MKTIMATSCLLLVTLVGCGGADRPQLAEVEGLVTKNGTPVTNAIVTFYPEEGRQSAGKTNPEGRFQLLYTADESGAVVGQHMVHISYGGIQEPGAAGSPTDAKRVSRNPQRQEVDWPQKVEVKPEDNEFTFEVE